MRRVRIWALDGGLGSGITGPIDVLSVANATWMRRMRGKAAPLFEWSIESPDGGPIRTANGVVMQADGAISLKATADVVLLPGLFTTEDWLTRALKRSGSLLPYLRGQHERGTVIAANCSSTFLVAESGLLDRRAATTSWWLAAVFRQRYPLVDLRPDEILTEQDGLLCSGAATHLALRLVEKFGGAELAASTAKSLLMDANRLTQAPYRVLSIDGKRPHADPLVRRAQRWMERHLEEPFRLQNLADALRVSERTLIRHFNQAIGATPVQHLQTLKIELAKRLLETTALSVDGVSEHVGYTDLSTFRRLFKRKTGLSPRDYHHRFARRHLRSAAPTT
jgi:transcriptional regulator GlxA family with amidase domain